MTVCINLRETYGDRYRVDLEEPAKSYADPWYHIIPCQHGHIYVHGDDELGWASDRPGARVRRVLEIPGTVLWQDGDDGANVVFPAAVLDQVAEVVHPKRRRRLSEEQRAALIARGAEFRFQAGAQSGFETLERVQTPSDHLGAVPSPACVFGARSTPVEQETAT